MMVDVLPYAIVVRLRDGSKAYVYSQDRDKNGEVTAINGKNELGYPMIWMPSGRLTKGIRKSLHDIVERFDSVKMEWIKRFPIA